MIVFICNVHWTVFVHNPLLITRNTLQSSVQTCDSCHRAEMGCPAKNGEMKMIKCPSNISLRDSVTLTLTFCWYLLGLTQIMAPLTNVGRHWGREESSVISWSGQESYGDNSASLAGVTSSALSWSLTAGESVSDSWLVTMWLCQR